VTTGVPNSHLLMFGVVYAAFLIVVGESAVAQQTKQDKNYNASSRNTEQRTGMFATEVWLTPRMRLPGATLLIASMSARFGQLHTEIHRAMDHPDAHAKTLSRQLLRRSRLFRDALVALYAQAAATVLMAAFTLSTAGMMVSRCIVLRTVRTSGIGEISTTRRDFAIAVLCNLMNSPIAPEVAYSVPERSRNKSDSCCSTNGRTFLKNSPANVESIEPEMRTRT